MAQVRSTWAEQRIIIGGALTSREWNGAGRMPIPAGYLMVKNDDRFLYVALDMVSDRGNDAGTGDYFWFTIDVNGNRQITPRHDLNYGLYPGYPNRMGRQYYLGPGVWTTLLNEVSESQAHIGFGVSPNSSTAHRVWEMRLALDELGASISSHELLPMVRFGVRISSTTPRFTYNYPARFYYDFSNLHEIILARSPDYPSGTVGAVIGGVGLIPASTIINGYAQTGSSYYVAVDEAAFGGRMNLIGNRVTMQDLWNRGARKYKMLHQIGSSGSFSSIHQNWVNYRWNGTTYVLERFGPDTADMYPLLDPSLDYSIDDLLLQWQSVGFPAAIHQFKAEFFDNSNNPVSAPSQVLELMVDNNLPHVDIVDIKHGARSVSACAIEHMRDARDGVRFQITVEDAEEHLKDYYLTAHWGDGQSDTIHSDTYAAHRAPDHKWRGVQNLMVPSGVWVPNRTCAHQFRLTAYPRVTNGYGYIWHHNTDTRHVTLIKPVGVASAITPRLTDELPYGLLAKDRVSVEGEEPDKLGEDTEIADD